MVSTFKLSFVILYAHLIFSKQITSDHQRTKRIINGKPLNSHDTYETQFIVELVHTPFCASAQFNHRMEDCEDNDHMCMGALIRSDFVLTACHCMVYEDFYALETEKKLPPISDMDGFDQIAWIDEKYPLNSDISWIKTTPKHPILTLMTIWAGNTSRHSSPQRRHAAAFYPHHLCGARQAREYPERWLYGYEMDIGLVKSCEPFKMNEEVSLATFPTLDATTSFINKIQAESHVCLFAGWGLALQPGSPMIPVEKQERYIPEVLQHTFRYLQCHSECSRHYCYLCTTHHGTVISHPKSGDSGTPVICDGLVVGVHSGSREKYELNVTDSVEVSVACVREFVTEDHTNYLRSLDDEIFHWQSGKPVLPASKMRFVRSLEDSEHSYNSTSSRHMGSLIFTMFHYMLWTR